MTDRQALSPPESAGPAVPPPDGRLRSHVLLIGAVLLLVELNAMAIQMVVPALRSMAVDFPVSGLAWVLTIVTVVGAALQPLGGRLADKLSLRPMILGISAIFLVGSLLCALSSSFLLLLVGRALQSVVLIIPAVAYCIFREALPARVVPIALGALGTGFGVAGLIGPIIAGALIDAWGYRALFWFFAVYIVVVTPLVYVQVPRHADRRTAAGRLDIAGAVTLTTAVGLTLVGLSEGAAWGWTSLPTLVSLVVGVALFGVFLVIESRVPDPMIDLRVFRTPAVALTLLVGFLGMVSVIGYAFALPQMLQTPVGAGLPYAFGLGALAVGLVGIPYGLFGMFLGPIGGALSRRFSVRSVMLTSMALLLLGSVLLAFVHSSLVAIIVWSAIIGSGFGLYWAAQPNLMVEAVPAHLTGVSAGVQVCVVAFATSVTSALVGAALANDVIGAGPAGPVYGPTGFDVVFLTGAGAALLGLLVTLAMRHGRRPATGGTEAAVVVH